MVTTARGVTGHTINGHLYIYYYVDFFFFASSPVWAQDDLLKLLEAMKVALPQKDMTKYKTSESHLDWQKVAFNTFTAEMCRQKWLEVSKEASRLNSYGFICDVVRFLVCCKLSLWLP